MVHAVVYAFINMSCNVLRLIIMYGVVYNLYLLKEMLLRVRLLFQEHPVHTHTFTAINCPCNLLTSEQLHWSILGFRALVKGHLCGQR